MTTTIDKKAFRESLDSVNLVHGAGSDSHNACSIAAWNLFLTGELKDDIPDCINPVIGRFVIGVQDRMPVDLLNTPEYRDALARIAGTNVLSNEKVREVLMDWLYGTVLPTLQPLADKYGFGTEWSAIKDYDTAKTAQRAYAAAAAAAYAAAAAARARAGAAAWQGFDIPALLNRFADLAETENN